jgi:aminobenzoyl-glutamate utilization protein B
LAKADRPIQDFVMPIKTSNAVGGGSSDVGDVSWNCPTTQFYIATWVSGTKPHSWQAVAVGKSSCAHKATLLAGQVLAETAIDLLEQPEKIEAAKAELKERLGNSRYECPIPEDVKPDAPF